MNPIVSIIIPVYNHEEALKKALVSIANQTYKEVEVIIVDDGSVPPVIASVAKQSSDAKITTPPVRSQAPRNGSELTIRLIRQENKGAPAARNRGLQTAKGEYVIFWDADLVAKPDMLEKMLQALEKNTDASFVYSNFYFGKHVMPAQAFQIKTLKVKNYIHSTSLIRRSAVIPWDETLKRFQDWDLWLTMSEQGKQGVLIDEYLFHVEPRKQGISSWLPSFAYKNPWRVLPGIRERVKKYEEARKIIERKHHL